MSEAEAVKQDPVQEAAADANEEQHEDPAAEEQHDAAAGEEEEGDDEDPGAPSTSADAQAGENRSSTTAKCGYRTFNGGVSCMNYFKTLLANAPKDEDLNEVRPRVCAAAGFGWEPSLGAWLV